jgi:hypothetical protein
MSTLMPSETPRVGGACLPLDAEHIRFQGQSCRSDGGDFEHGKFPQPESGDLARKTKVEIRYRTVTDSASGSHSLAHRSDPLSKGNDSEQPSRLPKL